MDRIQYGYDRASNRIWRKNTVAPDGGNDELYSYDGAQRLIDMSRGDLVESDTAIDDATFAQSWQLDATGNWSGMRQLDTLTPTSNLDQQRTANRANEITNITRRFGTNWTTPAYDRAGNTTSFPKPTTPSSAFTATYDAWNRLISVTEEGAESPTATYSYDGLNRRITSDDNTNVRHTYFTAQWQWLEERLDSSTSAERQAIWGLRYIDDLVLRDRSPTNNGTLSERLYCLQDANWNTTAVVAPSGDPQERYRYTAYGTPTFLNPDFTPKSPNESAFAWETLYCGYHYETAICIYLVRTRHYHELLGEWLCLDSLLNTSGQLMKSYVFSNPLILIDPTGQPIVVNTGVPTSGGLGLVAPPRPTTPGVGVGPAIGIVIIIELLEKLINPPPPPPVRERPKIKEFPKIPKKPDINRPPPPPQQWEDACQKQYKNWPRCETAISFIPSAGNTSKQACTKCNGCDCESTSGSPTTGEVFDCPGVNPNTLRPFAKHYLCRRKSDRSLADSIFSCECCQSVAGQAVIRTLYKCAPQKD